MPLAAASESAAGATNVSSIFAPVSAPADLSLHAATVVLAITATIFVVVAGLLAYAIVAFRRRADDDGSEPPQVYGSDRLELAWTVLPIVLVVVLCLVTARTVYDVQAAPRPPGALDVTVVGHQWWWEIRYPGLGIVTANELHVPVSEPGNRSPTFLTLASADVVHSFWVPQLAGKTDLIPNRRNLMWIEPREPGVYRGQCAEYCGTQHAHMLLRVHAQPRADFDRWVAEQQATPQLPDTWGRRIFESTACVACHTVRGTSATGTFGPDLTHLMSRETLGAGAARMSARTLDAWIADPHTMKPGVLMPAMQLSGPDRWRLVKFLVSLR